ncbi:hypothetical protein QZH41_007997 [Actinostola sp. cb2023]|nr:hypothetical protein QZH41_007997 [Actinostola sp. cb2023]
MPMMPLFRYTLVNTDYASTAGLYSVPKNETTNEKAKEEVKKEKKSLFQFSVLKNKAFLVWCVSLGIFMIGYFVPFVHLPGYAIECGISNEKSATLVGMMSIGSTFGRLFFGKLCDHPRVNRLYMVVFGVFDGCFVVLLGVLCADIVGYDKVAAGMGIQFFFMAITCTAGPPLAENPEEISAPCLLTYLDDQMGDLSQDTQELSRPDLTARTLLDAAETFNDNSKFKRIEGHLGWFALVGFDVDDMESGGSSSEEDQSETMDIVNTPPKPKLNHHYDYKKKYHALRRFVKELVFLNAATGDDIARTEAKLSRAKAERK